MVDRHVYHSGRYLPVIVTHHSRVRAGIQNMVTGAKNPTSTKRPHHSALASRKNPTQTHPYRCHPRRRLYVSVATVASFLR